MDELSRAEEGVRLRLELAKTKDYLTINDVQLLTGYSPSTIRRRIETGSLKVLQNEKHQKLLFKRSDVRRWLENGRG